MHTMNPGQGTDFLHATAIEDNEPVMVWGGVGVGKTTSTAAMCRQHGYRLVDLRASLYDSFDFRGLPTFRTNSEGLSVTEWSLVSTLPYKGNDKFDPDGPTIVLFLDEITHVRKPSEGVLYGLVQERRVGEFELMDNVRIIAAGNRAGDKGVGNKMSLPAADRFTHVEYVPDLKQFAYEYAPSVGLDMKKVAFFLFAPECFNNFDPSNPNKQIMFSTSRSIERAIRYDMRDRPREVREAQFAGAVGTDVATQYYAYMDNFSKIVPIKEILADPEGARVPETNDVSLMHATATNVSGCMDAENVDLLHRYLKRLPASMMVYAWVLAVARDRKAVMNSAAWREMALEHSEAFTVSAGASSLSRFASAPKVRSS